MRRMLSVGITALRLSCAAMAMAEEGPKASGPSTAATNGTAVLDAHSYWRIFLTVRPTVYGVGKDIKLPPDGELFNGPLPPADWTGPDFDDSGWWRDPGPVFAGPGLAQGTVLALLCLRGKFEVADPSRVKDLRLTMSFRGGAVVYLNGQEVGRGNMPGGKVEPLTLADDYPLAVHQSPSPQYFYPQAQMDACAAVRTRQIKDLIVPVRLLRKGLNVLAVEIHRAALYPDPRGNKYKPWNTAGLLDLRLETPAGDGLSPAVDRPQGPQVWNTSPQEFVLDVDYGTPGEKLQPVRIAAARNGSFSGVVVLSSDSALRSPSARMGDLAEKKTGSKIEGAGVQVRYALDCGRAPGHTPVPCPYYGAAFDLEREASKCPHALWQFEGVPPPEVPVASAKRFDQDYRTRIFGAVLPIWVTIPVPKASPAGTYEGVLTVTCDGSRKFDVPVELKALDWTLPDPADFKTFTDFIESPESVQRAYDVKLWSDEHFKMMAKTFDLIREFGNKTLYIPVRARTDFGNGEGMVRWIKEADGSYKCDFSVMNKYLDTALAHMGRPRYTIFYVWDMDLGGKVVPGHDAGYPGSGYGGAGGKEYLPTGKHNPIKVSYLDPATGAVSEGLGPTYVDPRAKAFWEPFVKGMTEEMKKRGLEKTVTLGLFGDAQPLKEVMEFWRELLPDAPWASSGHSWTRQVHGSPVAFATAWRYDGFTTTPPDPAVKRIAVWREDRRKLVVYRLDTPWLTPGDFWMTYERNLTSGQIGVGRLFADFFPVRLDPKSRRSNRLLGRFVETSWGTMNWGETWLQARPEGPVASVAFESLRSGIQETEARIFIQDAILDQRSKLGEALAQRAQDVLDERVRRLLWVDNMPGACAGSGQTIPPYASYWLAGSGWPERTGKLYATAAEVARALK
jgi:hypothetical protein